MKRAINRAIRTLLQLVAAGGLTALVAALGDGLDTESAALLTIGWGVVVAFAQNLLEGTGTLPVLLPSPPVPPKP